MVGGELRFGTASIYMAQGDNIRPSRTSKICAVTWRRFRQLQGHFSSTAAAFIVSARGKLGLTYNRLCGSGSAEFPVSDDNTLPATHGTTYLIYPLCGG